MNNRTKIITLLESYGARRWTKGEKDRLYLKDAISGLCKAIGALEGRTAFTRSMEAHWSRSNYQDLYLDLNSENLVRGYIHYDAFKGPDRDLTENAFDMLENLDHELWNQLIV